MIALIDYGAGNLASVRKGLAAAGADVFTPAAPADLTRAIGLVICLGMQYLFEGSDEAPGVPGLGLMRGTCSLLPSSVKVPHVGWNSLALARRSALLDPTFDEAQVYFTHSYAAPVTEDCVATSEHGARFAAVVERGRAFGVQFHPEKSSDAGLRILRAFMTITQSPNHQIPQSP